MAPPRPRRVSTPRLSASPAHPHTRAPLERIWAIHARLGAGRPANAVTLARDLEVCTRTIKRDIDMMRDRLGLPVEWNNLDRTYFYSRPCETLPLLRISAQEALAFALASRLFSGLRSSGLGQVLEAVFKKIAPVLGGNVSVAFESVQAALFTAADTPVAALEPLVPLLGAIERRRKVEFAYTKPGATRPERRRVHPLHVAELDHQWLLVAHDPARRDQRNFVLTRMTALRVLPDTFAWPKHFDVTAYLRGCLGLHAGDGEHEVRLALDAHAAFYAREKPWHPSQVLTNRPDGRIELTLRLNHLADARIAALRWADHAEVLAPAELRDQVRASLELALKRYHATTGC